MKLSTKGRYAVTAMIDLALNEHGKFVTLADISHCQSLSLSYLEQLFSKLRKHGLVKGVRGPGGGYTLAKKTSDISISSIVLAVDERIDFTKCERDGNCQGGDKCLTHELWISLSDQLKDYLDSISLADLVNTTNSIEIPLNN